MKVLENEKVILETPFNFYVAMENGVDYNDEYCCHETIYNDDDLAKAFEKLLGTDKEVHIYLGVQSDGSFADPFLYVKINPEYADEDEMDVLGYDSTKEYELEMDYSEKAEFFRIMLGQIIG